MTLVAKRLLNWSLVKGGPRYAIVMVVDDADFDVDPVLVDVTTGRPLHHNRILGIKLSSPRGGRFDWIARGRSRMVQSFVGTQSDLSISVLDFTSFRITEQNFGWSFTPDHVPAVPGSVSNPSLLTSGGVAGGSTSFTTADFTPTANGLLVLVSSTHTGSAQGHTYTITNSHSGSGAWSQVLARSPSNSMHSGQGYSQTGASPGSGTITNTVSAGGSFDDKAWVVYEVAGHDTTTPLSESNTGGANTGTTLAISIAGVAAGNLAIGSLGIVGNSSPAITPGTGETELTEVGAGGGQNIIAQVQYSADAAEDWAWGTSAKNAGTVIEWAAAGGAAALPGKGVVIRQAVTRAAYH